MDQDFSIRLSSNAAQEIANFQRLRAVVLQTQAAINSTNAASARTAASSLAPGATRALDTATAAQGRLGAQTGATTAALGRSGAAFDDANNRVQRHARSLGETAVLYAAITAAATGAAQAISLAATADTESRRLEAVLGLPTGQGRQFVAGVGQVAVSTATPFEDLLSESDLVASAFADVEDAALAEAKSLELLNRVGQTTTITQRAVRDETQNLIAIMRLGGVEVENLGDVLGQVVTAGNSSSTSIAAILDALRIALPGAKIAGVTLEQLIALTGQFRAETQRSGTEIGHTFATLFQTISQPAAEETISTLTGGLVELRDEAGNLRPVLDVLAQLRTLIDEGAIAAEKLPDIFRAFAPPLNPAAAKDVALIFDMIGELPAALREVETSSSATLNNLVEKLNAALGPQARILIEQVKAGFLDLFSDDIVSGGQTLIDLMRSLGAALQTMPPETLRALAGFLALTAAWAGLSFVGSRLVALLGLGGITGALTRASAQAAVAGRSFGFMSAMGLGFLTVLSKILPLLAAFMAIDFAAQVGAQQDALVGSIGTKATGLDAEGLRALRGRLEAQKSPGLIGSFGPGSRGDDILRVFTTDPALDKGIAEIDRLLAQLESRGEGATVAVEDLGEGFTGASDASAAVTDAITEQSEAMDALIKQYTTGAEALGGMTEAERIEAEAATLIGATREKQAADLEKLGERLRTGKISAEEFAQGQQVVAQAADLAAQLVATVGDRLGEYPLFADAAAEGNEALTARVYEMIVASGGSINAIGGLIGQLGNLAAANAAVAGSLASHPLVVKLAVQKIDSATLANNPELLKAQRFAQAATGQGAGTGADAQVKAILDSINSLVGGFGAGSPAFGNVPSSGGGSAGPKPAAPAKPDPTLFDINDLPPAMLAQAIALATRLQNSIPGAKAQSKDEILNIISDARFLRTVKGLDDALLRKAIDQLTEVEKERLEEEKRKNAANELLSNLQVNAGPLGALISQPTLFGVGGSIPAGLNADPSKGNFQVNIPVELKGLEPDKLQAMIYAAVIRAVRDGIRLQGGA